MARNTGWMEVPGGSGDGATTTALAGDMSDFTTSFAQLQGAVRDACRGRAEWPDKIAAAIYAAVEFAAANPDATRTLTMEARVARDEGRCYLQMIEYFSELLRLGTPEDLPLASSTEEALVGGIAAVVSDHMRSGRAHRLGDIAPELVYLTLLPYLGFSEAKRWAWPAPSL
jgi:hypothetical protein